MEWRPKKMFCNLYKAYNCLLDIFGLLQYVRSPLRTLALFTSNKRGDQRPNLILRKRVLILNEIGFRFVSLSGHTLLSRMFRGNKRLKCETDDKLADAHEHALMTTVQNFLLSWMHATIDLEETFWTSRHIEEKTNFSNIPWPLQLLIAWRVNKRTVVIYICRVGSRGNRTFVLVHTLRLYLSIHPTEGQTQHAEEEYRRNNN